MGDSDQMEMLFGGAVPYPREAGEEAGKSQIGKTPTNSQLLSLISKLSIITGLLQDRVDELEYRIKLLTTRF